MFNTGNFWGVGGSLSSNMCEILYIYKTHDGKTCVNILKFLLSPIFVENGKFWVSTEFLITELAQCRYKNNFSIRKCTFTPGPRYHQVRWSSKKYILKSIHPI